MSDSKPVMTSRTPPEQVTYANMLFYGCWGSLALMAVTYLIYVSGFMTPYIPLETITQLWSQRVGVYLDQGHVPHGWGWATLLGYGDFLNFLGIALLAGMTVVCFVPLIPAFIKKKEPVMTVIAILEILVLTLAASGLISGGGH